MMLGGVFIWSSIPKILEPTAFLRSVEAYDLVPTTLAPLVAAALPAVELTFGALLVANLLVPGAALGSFILGTTFVLAQASALWRGLQIACGCFSVQGDEMVGDFTLFRAVVVWAGASFILALNLRAGRPRPT
jgi:hypothetical protein